MCAQFVCEECGFRGLAGPASARAHIIYHDEHIHGVRLRRLELFEQVAQVQSHEILLVRPESHRFARLRAERVSRRAIEEPIDSGGYDKPTFYAENPYRVVHELHSHALILARNSRGCGLLVIERRDRDAWYGWEPSADRYRLESTSSAGAAWSIVHIWLLPSLRGQHLATALLDLALKGFGIARQDIGWHPPFTPNGFLLLRRFAPESFWASGDVARQPDQFPHPFD
jgi:hypothetical protein